MISFYNELPISVELPNQVNFKIETTDVASKGQTVSSSYKPAIFERFEYSSSSIYRSWG